MPGPFTFTIRDINTGNPVPGAKIQILTDAVIVDTQISDASGNVTITSLDEGFYDVIVSKDGYLPVRLNREVLQNSFLYLEDLQLKPESYKSNLYGKNSGGTWEPLKTSSPGILSVNIVTESESLTGICYVVDTGSLSVPVDQYLLLQLNNPPGSGKRLNIKYITGGTSASISASNMILSVLKNASFPESGVSLTPSNTNLGFPDASSATAKYVIRANLNIGGSKLWTYMVSGGTQADYLGLLIMPPNSQIVISLKNTDNQVNTFAANICWSEEEL
ncbi:MAG: hypothetical protein JM58_17765 [Peptococcaceae bacterium BICA1-8]|nr:MAG: hypothetical protein JM58_17765 [Peptococcaceae bacterium BICA1-8]